LAGAQRRERNTERSEYAEHARLPRRPGERLARRAARLMARQKLWRSVGYL
jgi:hypothetical protein